MSVRCIFKSLLMLAMGSMAMPVFAGGFFETGSVTIDDSIDNGNWETVTLDKTYVNPVVIASPLSHNNSHSLFPRVRNVTSTSFQIGMQSPCESYGIYNGPHGSDPTPEQDVCPPAAGWQSEEVHYWVVEEGVWEFPSGEEIEAFATSTTAVRTGIGPDTIDQIALQHTFANSSVIVYTTVNSFNNAEYVGSVATNDGGVNSPPAPTAADNDFGLMMELMEFDTTHPAETIGWVAMLAGSGTNAGSNWNAGIAGNIVDRHQDACDTLGSYSVGTDPDVVSTQNTVRGNNGTLPRLCGTGIGDSSIQVHTDEDQVRDAERTGLDETLNWFAFEKDSFGVLDFLKATKTASESGNDGIVAPGDTITYTIAVTNVLDDFDQTDNPSGPELIDPLPANVSFVSATTPTTGTINYNATEHRIEWNAAFTANTTETATITVQVDNDACPGTEVRNQATLLMDVNGDGDNAIGELSDDPAVDIEGDSDMDTATDDDDPTILNLQCPRLTLAKNLINDNGGTATISSFVLSATGTPTISGISGSGSVTNTVVGVGDYTLSETTVPGYTASAWTCTDGSLTGDVLTLAADDTATCTITNNDTAEADMKITKSVSDDEPNVGDTVTFQLTVENLGPADATGIDIVDIVPAGFSYVPSSISGGDSNDDSDPTGTGLNWNIASLASGTSVTVSFQAVVQAP